MAKIEWRPWSLLGVFSLVSFLINASTFSSLGVVLPDMVRDLKLSWTQGGFGFTMLGSACGASALLPALLIRRFGVRVTLLAGTAVMASGFFCLSRANGAWIYFLGTGLCGVGFQMMSLIPGTHVLAAVFQKRGMPFGVYFTFAALGSVAGPWMVWAFDRVFPDGWRSYWLAQMALALALGALCAAMVGGRAWLAKIAARTDSAVAAEVAAPAAARGVYRTAQDWSLRDALRTPQFLILLAAYFGHLLVGTTVASASLVGDRIDPRHLLMFAVAALALGSGALSIARDYPMMLVYAIGSGLGFGLTALAVTMLLLNYFGRRHNLEIFARTCMAGAFSALGPTLGGRLRDVTGSFSSTFVIYALVAVVIFIAVAAMRPPRPRESSPGVLGSQVADAADADRAARPA